MKRLVLLLAAATALASCDSVKQLVDTSSSTKTSVHSVRTDELPTPSVAADISNTASYQAADKLVPLVTPTVKDIDATFPTIFKGMVEQMVIGTSPSPVLVCVKKAGWLEVAQRNMANRITSANVRHELATLWASRYSLEELNGFNQYFSNPAYQKFMGYIMDGSIHPGAPQDIMNLQKKGLLTDQEIQTFGTMQHNPKTKKLLQDFDKDIYTSIDKLVAENRPALFKEAADFSDAHQNEINKCVEESMSSTGEKQ